MTKAIIIDGVDVSECEYLKNGSCSIEILTPCPYNPGCYYKQLQRLKAEKKQLKENLLFINREISQIANDGLTHHVIQTALLGLNAGMADIIRNLRNV